MRTKDLKLGRLRLVPFVRRELWDLREDRKALENYLRNDLVAAKELTEDKLTEVVNHPSKFLNDAETIFAFIDEVARTEEMVKAINTHDAYPQGNWVHAFDSFGDIVTALQQSIKVGGNLRRRGLLANLRHEIALNLLQFLQKRDDKLQPQIYRWRGIRAGFLKQVNPDFMGESRIDALTMNTFCMCCIQPVPFLETTFLEECLSSGEFLEYDRESDSPKVGSLQARLIELLKEIRSHLRSCQKAAEGKNLLGAYGTRDSHSYATVKNTDLIAPIAALDGEYRLITKLIATYAALQGKLSATVSDGDESLLFAFDIPLMQMPTLEECENWLKVLVSDNDTKGQAPA